MDIPRRLRQYNFMRRPEFAGAKSIFSLVSIYRRVETWKQQI